MGWVSMETKRHWFSYLATSYTSDLAQWSHSCTSSVTQRDRVCLCACYYLKKEQLKVHASCSRRLQMTTEDQGTTPPCVITISNQDPGYKSLHSLSPKQCLILRKNKCNLDENHNDQRAREGHVLPPSCPQKTAQSGQKSGIWTA